MNLGLAFDSALVLRGFGLGGWAVSAVEVLLSVLLVVILVVLLLLRPCGLASSC